jgi:3-isopropylmalate dehydrogenase
MFEPVHGSAPDIAGTGRANPLAAILSAGLMLEHLTQAQASEAVKNAVLEYLRAFPRQKHPIELGGEARTSEVGDTVASIIQRM